MNSFTHPSADKVVGADETTQSALGGRYKLVNKIGSGAFGDIWLGKSLQTGSDVAIKLEHISTKFPQLAYEYKLYKIFAGGIGIPSIRWFGREGDYNVLVMDLLGPSLEDLFNFCHRRFSLKSILMIADQLISRIEYVHSKHYLHRDIKPDNFLIGLGKRAPIIYVIDFGLAKKYRDPHSLHHMPYADNKNLTGTARYASLNTHLGVEQTRRDDLEAIGFVLMYFCRGSLPWQGLRTATKRERYEKIAQVKRATTIEALCRGYPTEFQTLLTYCRNLRFEEKPDYTYLKRLFRDSYFREGYEVDMLYDWNLLNYQESNTDQLRKLTERHERMGSPMPQLSAEKKKDEKEKVKWPTPAEVMVNRTNLQFLHMSSLAGGAAADSKQPSAQQQPQQQQQQQQQQPPAQQQQPPPSGTSY